jgi:RHS repeat-associated protein
LQPTQIGLGTASSDSSLLQLDYTYNSSNTNVHDNNGNVLTQTISIGSTVMSQSYFYDALNRLRTATEVSGWTQTFDYDRFGNRAIRTGSYIPTPALSPVSGNSTDFSAFNQNTNRIALTGFGYDNSGNLVNDPTTAANAIVYDAENRQVSYSKGGTTSYTYDGDGRRVKKVVPGSPGTTTVFVYNVSGQLIAEYTSDPVPPAQGGGGTSYLTSDSLGSTRVVTKFDGTIKARYDYLPFGEEIPSSVGGRPSVTGYSAADSTRQKFTQKERDGESGLDYFLARYYSSAQGRFTNPDEFSGGPDEFYDFADKSTVNPTFYADLTDPQSLNKYQYSYNNPLLYVDPDGHQGVREFFRDAARAGGEFVGGAIRGAAASLSFGYAPGSEPRSDDSIASRLGQAVGTGAVIGEGGSTAGGSGLLTVLTDGAIAPVSVPVVIVGVAETASGLVNAAKIVTTPVNQNNASQQGGQAQEQPQQKSTPSREVTPNTNPKAFEAVKGSPAKRNKETGEIWVKDRLHKDHYEVYKNQRKYERGRRARSVWADGRAKEKF